jgi:hypothetical protein
VSHRLLTPSALQALVVRHATARGVTVPRDGRAAIIALLPVLVGLLRRHWARQTGMADARSD